MQKQGKSILQLTANDEKELAEILAVDSQFLMRRGLMDYSLYLVVEAAGKRHLQEDQEGLEGRNLWRSESGRELYHIGVIDYLQKWDLSKKIERTDYLSRAIDRPIFDRISPKVKILKL